MIQLSDSDFTRLTGFLNERFGINLIKKRTLIESRLNNYLVSNGFDSYKTYLDYALSDKTGAEVSQMLNYLTTNYSYFMREWEHFKFLREHVLPEMAGVNRNHILFEAARPLAAEAVSPGSLQVSRHLYYEIAGQLMDVVRGLDPRIPLVSNGSAFLENLPRLTD